MKPIYFFPSAESFRAWLKKNHSTEHEVHVGYYKRKSKKQSITWPESVDEALCFGWIDGLRRSIDAERYQIRFTPRKKTSIWSAINVAKVAALEKAGRMTRAGRAAFAARTEARTGVYSFERRRPARLPPAAAKRLAANKRAHTFFKNQPPWYQRAALHWVVSAKRAPTREARLVTLISCSAAGKTIPVLTRHK